MNDRHQLVNIVFMGKLSELTVKELFMVNRRNISSLRLIAFILCVDHHLEITIKLGTQLSLKACVLNLKTVLMQVTKTEISFP